MVTEIRSFDLFVELIRKNINTVIACDDQLPELMGVLYSDGNEQHAAYIKSSVMEASMLMYDMHPKLTASLIGYIRMHNELMNHGY